MKSKIMELFTTTGRVITSPDELFYLKNQDEDKMGIAISIVFQILLGIIIGLITQCISFGIIVAIAFIIMTLIGNITNTIFIMIFTRLFGAKGGFMQTFNMISYTSAIDLVTIVTLALSTFKPLILVALLFVPLWKLVIQITAVNTIYNIGYVRSFLCCNGFLAIIAIIIMGLI